MVIEVLAYNPQYIVCNANFQFDFLLCIENGISYLEISVGTHLHVYTFHLNFVTTNLIGEKFQIQLSEWG